nr:immunoglobulin heavy chain junction region [Mus musculus]
CARWSFPFDYW